MKWYRLYSEEVEISPEEEKDYKFKYKKGDVVYLPDGKEGTVVGSKVHHQLFAGDYYKLYPMYEVLHEVTRLGGKKKWSLAGTVLTTCMTTRRTQRRGLLMIRTSATRNVRSGLPTTMTMKRTTFILGDCMEDRGKVVLQTGQATDEKTHYRELGSFL